MSNSLDPDKARRFAGPDLGPVISSQRLVGKELKIKAVMRKQNICSCAHCTRP